MPLDHAGFSQHAAEIGKIRRSPIVETRSILGRSSAAAGTGEKLAAPPAGFKLENLCQCGLWCWLRGWRWFADSSLLDLHRTTPSAIAASASAVLALGIVFLSRQQARRNAGSFEAQP